ncbi:MAG TPA: hypothetical protein VHA52_10470 [Candidatus Babeliaceae bacterium]|nr:hypothetical protein [Candidatus Babeliaceae bacterium]
MPKPSETSVNTLHLDLKNFRTLPQKTEKGAIKAMITIKSERFWAVLDSILDTGYLNTENIIVQKNTKGDLIVKEGNRRIAALKLGLGIHNPDDFDIPAQYKTKINALSAEWKKENAKVITLIFEEKEQVAVDKIVSLAHGKGDRASRDPWTSVATARHNRDANKHEEPSLDVLEKYLEIAQDITPIQKERWAADYPLTVLHELMRRLTPILGFKKLSDFSKSFPEKPIPKNFHELIREIGERIIGFEEIRDEDNFNLILNRLGLPVTQKSNESSSTSTGSNGTNGSSSTTAKTAKKAAPKKPVAISNTDPKFIIQTLKKFIIRGDKREKVVALRDEAVRLKDIQKYPYSFCFLLRSMFEISSKTYCTENKIPTFKLDSNNKKVDKKLIDLLKEARKHLISTAGVPKDIEHKLHGAISELSKPEGLLSVTSMNQLVHNTSFSTNGQNIASIFGNVFPLLEMINQ